MLVDDRPDLHVFMLRRNPRSVFGPGAFVFPGGAVDPADGGREITQRVVGLDDSVASARLGFESGGLRIWIAALRETFEEAGILLATGPEPDAERLAAARVRLNSGETALSDVLVEHSLALDATNVSLFSHWLTPEPSPRRYDTWFLVAPAPRGQEGSPDDAELVHSEWVRPADALARHASGDIELIFPTLRTLRVIESFTTAAELLAAVRDANPTDGGAPLLVSDASGERVALAGDDLASATRGWRTLTSRPDLDGAALLAEGFIATRQGVA
jgi:8-oxo-dGTP pyrophosphatase MutT (NUDIX family)